MLPPCPRVSAALRLLLDLHFTQMALFWLSAHQWPPLTLLRVSPSHAHAHARAWRRPIRPRSLIAPSSACRLEDAGSGGGPTERSVARQNGRSHERRSVYKPGATGGRRAAALKHHYGLKEEVCHDEARWSCETLGAARRTPARTLRLCPRFFLLQSKQQMVEGE